MLNKIKIFYVFFIVIYSFNVSALELNPYFGIDAQYNSFRFYRSEEARFKKFAPQINGYLGLKINKNFAIEVGHEQSQKTKNNILVKENEMFLGYKSDSDEDQNHLLELQFRNWHVDYIATYSLLNNLDLIGSVGLAFVKFSGADTKVLPGYNNVIGKMYSNSIPVFVLGGGVKYKINPHFGLRVMLHWQNTSKLKLNGRLQKNKLTCKMRNNYKLSIGFIANLL